MEIGAMARRRDALVVKFWGKKMPQKAKEELAWLEERLRAEKLQLPAVPEEWKP